MPTTTSPPILIWQPGGGVPVGPISNPPVYSQRGTTQLVAGQAYIDVVFGTIQTTTDWVLATCEVENTTDFAPLNIWPGIITNRTAAGFRLQLNGMPDSGNYYLHWAVSGTNIQPSYASTYLFSGPSSGTVGIASTFTVALPPSTIIAVPTTITPSDGASGTFTPATVGLTNGVSATFAYTPVSSGVKTISTTNDGGLTDPASLTFTALNVGYYRSLTVDHTKVPSTQTDFPVLVSITDVTLKTVANGGHVQRSDGFDIGFFSDSAGTSPLKWEIEKYDPATGELVAWVKIASLSSSADTVFYVRYGDAAITTDHSDPVNVWTNSFVSIYHLGNGTTLSAADSRNVANGTNVAGVTANVGKIDGCGGFSGSGPYIDLGSQPGTVASTVSAWVKGVAFGAAYNAVAVHNSNVAGTVNNEFFVKSNGKLGIFTSAASGSPSYDGTGANTLVVGTWYYIAATYDSVTGLIGYVNAAVDGTAAAGGAFLTTASAARIGSDPVTGAREWGGYIDEVRVSSVARSANWITTEYNNQNTPGTFITLGVEV